ncbi:MAG: tetratricopeptide repeat protein [bacterium]|nr:tetratricopeptide repeat protein [bacterium]
MYKLLILTFLGLFDGNRQSSVDQMHEECYSLFSTNIDSARIVASNALEISSDTDYGWGKAQSLFIIAYCDDLNDKLNQAVPAYLKALDMFSEFEREKARSNQSKIYLNLGRIFRIHYKYDDAINFYKRGLEIATDLDNKKLRMDHLHNMSIAYRHKGDLVKAAEIQFEKLSIHDQNDVIADVKSYNQLGLIHKDLGDYEESRNYFEHIVELQRDKKNSKYRARAYHNIATCFKLEGNTKLAQEMFERSLNEMIPLNRKKDIFITYLDLTELFLLQQNYDQAKKYGTLALDLDEDVLMNVENNKLNHYLSQIYFAKNQPGKAKLYFDRYVTQMESLYDQQKELASQGDQYKIELITSTYFAKIQEQEKINYYMVGVAGLVAFFILFLIYNRYRKVAAAKMLREHFSSISFNISNTSSSK